MDKDTIEIHSYLIRDSLLYSLLFIYFIFFLVFFICIVKFNSIKKFCSRKSNKPILPLYSTSKKHAFNQYKYTNLENQYDLSNDQITSDTDYKKTNNDLMICPALDQLKDLKKNKPFTAFVDKSNRNQDELPLISSPEISSYSDSSKSTAPIIKKNKIKCGFNPRKKQCSNKNCTRKNYFSKLICKYYSKLKKKSPSIETINPLDHSSIFDYDQIDKNSKKISRYIKQNSPPSDEVNREKALKCYQEFIENRFTKPNNINEKSYFEKKLENELNKSKIKEDLKEFANEIKKNDIILTPKQLNNYEPFKTEIANPMQQKIVEKNLNEVEKIDKVIIKKIDQNKDQDYNFLRLANDLKQQALLDKSSFEKSPKIYLGTPSISTQTEDKSKKDRSINSLDLKNSNDADSYENCIKNKKKTIPDLNRILKNRLIEKNKLDEANKLRLKSLSNQNEKIRDVHLAKKLKKELDHIKEEKFKILKNQKEQIDKINELNSMYNKLKNNMNNMCKYKESPTTSLDSKTQSLNESQNLLLKDNQKENIKSIENVDSYENIGPLVNRMKNEMKHLKPIEFKPLQTVYLKENQSKLDSLKLSKIPINKKQIQLSPSLKSDKLFSVGKMTDLNNDIDLINLKTTSKSNEIKLDDKLCLNNILNLKDKQIEKDESLNKLNISSIEKLLSKDQTNEANQKLVSIEKQTNIIDEKINEHSNQQQSNQQQSNQQQSNQQQSNQQQSNQQQTDQQQINQQSYNATGKKSKIPTLNDKFKKSKSLTLNKRGIFSKKKLSREDRVDSDLERMFNLKFQKK